MLAPNGSELAFITSSMRASRRIAGRCTELHAGVIPEGVNHRRSTAKIRRT